jgi:hypothetical protein
LIALARHDGNVATARVRSGAGQSTGKLSGNVKKGAAATGQQPPGCYLGIIISGLVGWIFFDFFKRLLDFLAAM